MSNAWCSDDQQQVAQGKRQGYVQYIAVLGYVSLFVFIADDVVKLITKDGTQQAEPSCTSDVNAL